MATNWAVQEAVNDYLWRVSGREPEVLTRLRAETAGLPVVQMQISAEEGQLLALLVRLMGARLTLDIGVFTGYSSTVVASALPDDGRVIACDVNEDVVRVARRCWREAKVEHKIDFRSGPALETLDSLLRDRKESCFDFAFVDADASQKADYFDRILRLLRPGGLVAFDNVLWFGKVFDDGVQDRETQAIRSFNEMIGRDERVWLASLPIADGLTLALKK